MWHENRCAYREKFTLDASGLGALSNFPARITSTRISVAARASVRVYHSDGTLLKHEVESQIVSGGTTTTVLWVKVPTVVAGDATQHVFVYWGTASLENAEDAANVWDDSFVGVWHLAEQTDAYLDSKNSYDLSVTGGSRAGSGVGYCFIGDGEDYAQVADAAPLRIANDGTIEAYVKLSALAVNPINITVFSKWATNGQNGYVAYFDNTQSSKLRFRVVEGLQYEDAYANAAPEVGVWYHVAGRIVSRAGALFVDGVKQTDTWSSRGAGIDAGTPFMVGRALSNSTVSCILGSIDEVRVSSVGRSDDWLKATSRCVHDTFATSVLFETAVAARSAG